MCCVIPQTQFWCYVWHSIFKRCDTERFKTMWLILWSLFLCALSHSVCKILLIKFGKHSVSGCQILFVTNCSQIVWFNLQVILLQTVWRCEKKLVKLFDRICHQASARNHQAFCYRVWVKSRHIICSKICSRLFY